MEASAVAWRAMNVTGENEVRGRMEAQELAIAGTLAAAAVFAVAGQAHFAIGAAAIGFAAMLARGPKSAGGYDVENAEYWRREEDEAPEIPHYSG